MKGEDFFHWGGESLIRRSAIIYRYKVSPGRIIAGNPPGETFLGAIWQQDTGRRPNNRFQLEAAVNMIAPCVAELLTAIFYRI